MNIELKNVKYAAFASEETSCFEAVVYIDGKRGGRVSNEGRGGPNRYDPWKLRDTLNEHAKTLPPTSFVSGGETHTLDMDADLIIGELLNSWLYARDLRRALNGRLLYLSGGKVYQTKKLSAVQLQILLGRGRNTLCGQLKATAILNLLPFDDALTIYRKQEGQQ